MTGEAATCDRVGARRAAVIRWSLVVRVSEVPCPQVSAGRVACSAIGCHAVRSRAAVTSS